jgi:hypothetical protein
MKESDLREIYMWCYTNHTETVYEVVAYTSEFRRGTNDSINGEETLASARDNNFFQ